MPRGNWLWMALVVAGCGAPDNDSNSPKNDGLNPADAPAEDIWTATSHGNLGALKKHLKAGTDINAVMDAPGVPGTGGTALHVAIISDQWDAFELLLNRKPDLHVKSQDDTGGTALHWAAAFGRLRMARALVEAGARINEPDKLGFTPLDATNYEPDKRKSSKLAIARLLKAKGATGKFQEKK